MEDFWKILIGYQIPKISQILLNKDTNEFHYNQTSTTTSNWEKFTDEYLNLCLNINKIANFLNNLKNSEDSLNTSPINASFKARRINLDFIGKCESIITNLVTSLETYLESVFRTASRKFELNKLKKSDLDDFYHRFNISPKTSNIKLNDVLKKRMDFQSKSNVKIAYRLIGIDLPSLVSQLWQEIFDTKRTGSLMRLRHRIVHNGLEVMKDHIFNFDEIYKLTMNVIKFIYKVEMKRKEFQLQKRDIVIIFDTL